MDLPPRRWLARGVLAFALVGLLLPVGVSAVTHDRQGPHPGTVTSTADGTTYVGVQGFHFDGQGSAKKPARLAAIGPRGTLEWTDTSRGQYWIYDVDPLENGNLLVTSTIPGETVVYEFDPEARERVWSRTLDAADTHDVDLMNDDELLVAEKSNFSDGVSHDRLFVYDLTRDEVVWEWEVRSHYPASTDGGMSADWTHVNDVEKVGSGRYMASLRNFDQVVVVNRSTKEVEWRLGEDDAHGTLYEQHNPDYLEGPDGEPTVLVADSENDRIVEYACVEDAADPVPGESPEGNCSWTATWTLTGFNWPRDADRLPNGNTLVVDSLNHRVVEVTPQGEVVWEYYVPWAPYDAERGADESEGPTMREQDVSGSYEVTGGAGTGPSSEATFSAWLEATTLGTPVASQGEWLASRYRHVTPFVRPVWMSSWTFASAIVALILALTWAAGDGPVCAAHASSTLL